MKKLIFISILFILNSVCFSQFTQQWVARFNGQGNTYDYPGSFAVDDSGNVYVTGSSSDNISVTSFTTVKYNSSGTQQWVQRYYGFASGPNEAASLTLDSQGNIYVTGTACATTSAHTDIVTIKYNNSGVQQWLRVFSSSSGGNCEGMCILLDNAGNIDVAGTINSLSTNSDFILIKYNSSGVMLWTAQYNGPENIGDYATQLTGDDTGNLYIAGISWVNEILYEYALVKYNSSGIRQWAVRQFGSDNTADQRCGIAVDRSYNVYLTGCSGYASAQSLFTSKYSPSGSALWTSVYNTPQGYADCEASAIVLDTLGNAYVTGFVNDYTNPLISGIAAIKYNSAGARQWFSIFNVHCFPGKGSKIVIDAERNLYICGYAEDSVTYDYDFVAVKYNNNGQMVWNAKYNGPGNSTDLAYRIALDRSKNVYVCGSSEGASTNSDFAVVKYSQPIGIEPITALVPNSYQLFQNYPNPFNPSTTIKFDIPQPKSERGMTTVRLVVYDVIGKVVATIINQKLQAGSYSVDWNATNYPSGVYFYRLEADNYLFCRKMVLIK